MKRALRRLKHREMTRIAARDLAGLSPLPEVTEDLSALASATLDAAVRFARRTISGKAGEPMAVLPDGTRRPCRFVVLGMGKLGGLELNFSSDVDLIYLYETDQGEVEGGPQPLSLHQYFVRLGETVSRIISEATEDGFVFRVDLRLRPEGTRGELVNSLRAAEIYYESWGQTWERAALIKARPVAGDLSLGEEFLRSLVPFVFRKYMDFTSIEEIKGMKDRINQAAVRGRKGERDLKLGAGGIREIEFFVQAHQLIYGGKEPSLRLRGTLETLEALSRLRIVTETGAGRAGRGVRVPAQARAQDPGPPGTADARPAAGGGRPAAAGADDGPSGPAGAARGARPGQRRRAPDLRPSLRGGARGGPVRDPRGRPGAVPATARCRRTRRSGCPAWDSGTPRRRGRTWTS